MRLTPISHNHQRRPIRGSRTIRVVRLVLSNTNLRHINTRHSRLPASQRSSTSHRPNHPLRIANRVQSKRTPLTHLLVTKDLFSTQIRRSRPTVANPHLQIQASVRTRGPPTRPRLVHHRTRAAKQSIRNNRRIYNRLRSHKVNQISLLACHKRGQVKNNSRQPSKPDKGVRNRFSRDASVSMNLVSASAPAL